MSELSKRVLAGICLAPPIVGILYFFPPKWFLLFMATVSACALIELVRMTGGKEKYFLALLALVAFIPLYRQSYVAYGLWLLFSPALYLFAVSLRRRGEKEKINAEIMTAINTLIIGQLFIVLPLFYFGLLKGLNTFFPLILLLAIWASDTGAYVAGKNFGKRPLAPLISPKKTVEGLFGAMVGSMLILSLSSRLLGFGIFEAIGMGAVIGVLGQTGDIFESIWKRVSNVKDSSSLIPGHGGILDRIDSFIFTAPLFYHYLSGLKI
ncbi:MAG TPA: phosphatidate cytidylyltransferase [Syntrophorhabdaceae bacterium]